MLRSKLLAELQAAGKDADKRMTVLRQLIFLVRDEPQSTKPAIFAEFGPLMAKKLHTEQENIKFQVLPDLLAQPRGTFPATVWKVARSDQI